MSILRLPHRWRLENWGPISKATFSSAGDLMSSTWLYFGTSPGRTELDTKKWSEPQVAASKKTFLPDFLQRLVVGEIWGMKCRGWTFILAFEHAFIPFSGNRLPEFLWNHPFPVLSQATAAKLIHVYWAFGRHCFKHFTHTNSFNPSRASVTWMLPKYPFERCLS